MRWVLILALATILTPLVAPLSRPAIALQLPEGVPAGAVEATVAGHVDGDKIKVRVGSKTEELLFIGVDAPEPKKGDKKAECFARESADHLKKLAPKGMVVYLESDEEDRDGKDRILRYVWIGPKGDKGAYLLNAKLVRDGYAGYDEMKPNTKYDARIKKAQEDAKAKNRGIWKECGGVHKPIPKSTPKPKPTQTAMAAPALYEIASEEKVKAPNGRTRYVYEAIFPGELEQDAVAAALVEIVRNGFLQHGDAVVVIVFANRSYDQIGGGYTVGRAAASRDGKGMDAGSGNLPAAKDDGRIQVNVVTEYSAEYQIALDEILIYVDL